MTMHRPIGIALGIALAAAVPGGVVAAAPAPASPAAETPETRALLDYLRDQHSTGFLVVRDGKTVLEQSWPPPADNPQFRLFVYGNAPDGALFEDVASQQKSFVAVLFAIALDKGLVDLDKPVSAYLKPGWSKASPEQEARITVDNVLMMNTGLDEKFGYVAPPGTVFFYNTPVYAISKRIVAAAAGEPLDAITGAWLTGPAGMANTAWRQRPGALASVGNASGLVTTPRDTALFGRMVLGGGVAANGTRIVSRANLDRLFEPSPTNPAYGRLWWLNSGAYAVRAAAGRKEGPLVAAAPRDMVAALGAFDRRLYVVPSRKLVVVRTGAAASDKDFDQQLWLRLAKVVD